MRNALTLCVVSTLVVFASFSTSRGAAPVAELNPPPVGTVWIYEQDGTEKRYERLPDGEINGQTVVRISNGEGMEALDISTWSMVATFDANGTAITSAQPHNGDMNWPLEVGKEWMAVRTYFFHPRDRSWEGATTRWVVEAYEEIQTPAGAFEAFRLHSKGIKHDTTERTLWLAPEPGIVVKEIYKRADGGGFTRSLKSFQPSQ